MQFCTKTWVNICSASIIQENLGLTLSKKHNSGQNSPKRRVWTQCKYDSGVTTYAKNEMFTHIFLRFNNSQKCLPVSCFYRLKASFLESWALLSLPPIKSWRATTFSNSKMPSSLLLLQPFDNPFNILIKNLISLTWAEMSFHILQFQTKIQFWQNFTFSLFWIVCNWREKVVFF